MPSFLRRINWARSPRCGWNHSTSWVPGQNKGIKDKAGRIPAFPSLGQQEMEKLGYHTLMSDNRPRNMGHGDHVLNPLRPQSKINPFLLITDNKHLIMLTNTINIQAKVVKGITYLPWLCLSPQLQRKQVKSHVEGIPLRQQVTGWSTLVK